MLWGIPYLFIKIADDGGFTPGVLGTVRGVLAGGVMLAFAWRSGTLSTLRGHGRWLCVLALTEIVIPFLMISIGEEHVSSSLSAIVVSSVPLIVALLAFRFDHTERPTRARALGLLLGFGGVVCLLGLDVAGHAKELLSALELLIGASSYAVGAMIAKHRMGNPDPMAAIGACLVISAVVSVPVAILDWPSRVPSLGALGALVVLAFGCGSIAFLVWMGLIREIGPGRTSVAAYINPVVAVLLGVTLLGEHLGSGAIVGLVLILAGSWLATGARLPRVAVIGRARPTTPEPPVVPDPVAPG